MLIINKNTCLQLLNITKLLILIKNKIIGFQNRSSVMINVKEDSLFKVLKGTGYKPDEMIEGIHYNNFYGTYLLGPILVRNPYFTDYIVKSICDNLDLTFKVEGQIEKIFVKEGEKGTKTASDKLKNLHEQLEKYTGEGENIYDYQAVASEDRDAYEETLAAYRHELYKTNGAEIHAKAGEDEELIEEFDSSEFNYYVNIYNQIKSCGGCVSINDYNGLNGDAANDSDWLQSMIQSGQFTIEIVETDKKTGDVDFSATSPSSDSCLSYTETTSIDKKELAKAEAKYENALRDIDKKDKEYDLSLSKLETERTALTTEYESVKKVITDNIDRTFGIFS